MGVEFMCVHFRSSGQIVHLVGALFLAGAGHSFAFFFFKQKTAYEMRISDWSSDVCSSDLPSTADELAQADHRANRIFAANIPEFLAQKALKGWLPQG